MFSFFSHKKAGIHQSVRSELKSASYNHRSSASQPNARTKRIACETVMNFGIKRKRAREQEK